MQSRTLSLLRGKCADSEQCCNMVRGSKKVPSDADIPKRVSDLQAFSEACKLIDEVAKVKADEYSKRHRSDSVGILYHFKGQGRLEKMELFERSFIAPLNEQRKEWEKERDNYLKQKLQDKYQTIEDMRTQIIKLKESIRIMLSAMNNFEKEARREFEAKHPFEHQALLDKYRRKLYKM